MESLNTLFTPDFFRGNRQRLRKLLPSDAIIVVTANGLLQRTADNAFPFVQESNFWYLTGINEPDLTLVIAGDTEYLIVPGRSQSREAFDGAVDHSTLTARSGITEVYDDDRGWQVFSEQTSTSSGIATLAAPPTYIEQFGLYPNPSRARLVEKLKRLAPDTEQNDIRAELASLRVIKQPPELAAIEEAIRVTGESMLALVDAEVFPRYHNEFEVEADLSREFRIRGAAGHAFAPIIAGGKRACTLHNVSNEAPLLPNTLVVLDVGAEVEHYAADITRTRAYGQPTPRQQEVFDAVLDVQEYALGLLKPGVLPKEYETQVEKYMGKRLQSLKLIELSGNAEKDREAVRKYYPHATSHFLGLDVHDAGDGSQPLEADMVLTCEPGIYIPEEGIGIRIEDDVLITADGNRILSADIPKTLV